MIERTHPKLSVGVQCRLLSISRSSFYYAPQGETAMNLDLMLLIDKQFLDTPFYGVRHPLGRFAMQIACRATDDMAPAERGPCRERKAHPAPYATDANLPKAQHPLPGNTC